MRGTRVAGIWRLRDNREVPGRAVWTDHGPEAEARLCARLTDDDRPGLARLHHGWEAITVRNLKLGQLWEPTPFPLELQGARG